MRPLGERGYLPSSQIKARYGWYASYDSIEDGIVNAVGLYGKLYSGRAPEEITRIWAQTNNPHYYEAINSCYKSM